MSELQIKLTGNNVDENNPWSDDALNSIATAQKLTAILTPQKNALTVSLNGEWGSGKTFLLKRWQCDLKNNGYTAIYFNAWEDDFLSDPFIAIIGQLWKELKKDSFKEVCEAVKTAAIPFLKRVGISMLNSGINKITGVDLPEIVDNELKTASESAFDNYVKLTDCRDDLKKRLQELADKIFSEKQKPLIFIVDELDRCRPTFAVEVLERIKHLFNIRHIIFVLGIDRKQLGKSIQAVYGNIDVENYLHRFIDIDFAIPEPDHKKFFDALWACYKIPEYLKENTRNENYNKSDVRERDLFKDVCYDIMARHNFSLREIEQTLKIYILLLQATPSHHGTWPYLAILLILLKLRNPELYQRYTTRRCYVTEIVDFIISEKSFLECDFTYKEIICAIYASFISVCPTTEQEYKILELINQMRNNEPLSQSSYCAKCLLNKDSAYYNDFVTLFSHMHNGKFVNSKYSLDILPILVSRIDLIVGRK